MSLTAKQQLCHIFIWETVLLDEILVFWFIPTKSELKFIGIGFVYWKIKFIAIQRRLMTIIPTHILVRSSKSSFAVFSFSSLEMSSGYRYLQEKENVRYFKINSFVYRRYNIKKWVDHNLSGLYRLDVSLYMPFSSILRFSPIYLFSQKQILYW